MKDCTEEATELFKAFAGRHGLEYVEDLDAPVEVLWRFPVQPKLSVPLILGLQNCDELNFGVDGFWSYFFPYPDVARGFEQIMDAWVEGRARIVRKKRRFKIFSSSTLEVLDESEWKPVYVAAGDDWEWQETIIQNGITRQSS